MPRRTGTISARRPTWPTPGAWRPFCGICGCSPDGSPAPAPPPSRHLASGFEIANVDDHARALSGATPSPPARRAYGLGALAEVRAWAEAVRRRLAGRAARRHGRLRVGRPGRRLPRPPSPSAYGSPLPGVPRRRCRPRGAGRQAEAALLVGREVFLADRTLTLPTAHRAARVLGSKAVGGGLVRRSWHLPGAARWAVDGIGTPAEYVAGGGRGCGRRALSCCRRSASIPRRSWALSPCSRPTRGGYGPLSNWPRVAADRWRSWMPRPRSRGRSVRQRVAIVAPQAGSADVLVRIAEAGNVEIDRIDDPAHAAPALAAARLGDCAPRLPTPFLCAAPPDLDALEEAGLADLLAGSTPAAGAAPPARRPATAAALAGWCPAAEVHPTAARLTDIGGVLVSAAIGGTDPPTLLRFAGPVRRSFAPLVRTYGTVPYADVDPTLPAGIVYVVMFGVMFGDADTGVLLLLAALLLCLGPPAGRAAAAAVAVRGRSRAGQHAGGHRVRGVLRSDGRASGALANPLDQPMRLLAAAVALGAVLLALSYGVDAEPLAEGGPANALYAASGIAGAALFLGLALLVAGAHLGRAAYALGGAALALTGRARGLRTVHGLGGGVGGAAQTGVQLFDIVVRIGSNVVSFARLAAFGLTHAALGEIVWHGTTGLADRGPVALLMAVLVFTVGNALAFALEALVAGVQALRLEFYEVVLRVFETQGRPFRPWQVPVQHTPVPHTEVAS